MECYIAVKKNELRIYMYQLGWLSKIYEREKSVFQTSIHDSIYVGKNEYVIMYNMYSI